jgi:RHS repeat-associated protein
LTSHARSGGCAGRNYSFLTQKERDVETGLDYFGARYYASAQGRFTSVDPLGASGRPGNPQSFNRYSYTLNNPLRFVDPTGLIDQDPANGQRALVSGSSGGITFGEGQVTRVFGHTHVYQFAGAGHQEADRAAIRALGQKSSWVLERGALMKFTRWRQYDPFFLF